METDYVDLTPDSDEDGARDEDGYGSDNESVATLPDEFDNLHPPAAFRNSPIEFPFEARQRYSPGDSLDGPAFILRLQDSVEVTGDCETFFRIVEIIKDVRSNEYFLRGWRFGRTNTFKGMLACKLNEVCRKLEVDDDDDRPYASQSMDTIPIQKVIKKRVLKMTNTAFPQYSFHEHTVLDSNAVGGIENKQSIYTSSELVCRWTIVTHFANATERCSRSKRRPTQYELRWNNEHETDPEYRTSDRVLTIRWLRRKPVPKDFNLPYTMADAFAGAGGASLAAGLAGLAIVWAFDCNRAATETYGLNFPNSIVYTATCDQIIALIRPDDRHHVDILHISPPCQPYSTANTSPNWLLNEVNQATLFSVQELINLIRPRIITLEETSGLLTHHSEWFHRLIGMITSNGYSLRWALTHLDAHGAYQKRKRLIVYASCPGGKLPKFPIARYGPGLRPYPTVADAMTLINNHPQVTHNNIYIGPTFVPRPPYSARQPLRNALTCGGIIDAHPTGLRPFTMREMAVLQGFTVDYKFCLHHSRTILKRQIGNAWPANAARVFFEQVAMTLEEEDAERYSGVVEAEKEIETITIDD